MCSTVYIHRITRYTSYYHFPQAIPLFRFQASSAWMSQSMKNSDPRNYLNSHPHAPTKIFHAPQKNISRSQFTLTLQKSTPSRNFHGPEIWARSRYFTLLLSDSADRSDWR
jgi:hypothetical protein